MASSDCIGKNINSYLNLIISAPFEKEYNSDINFNSSQKLVLAIVKVLMAN